MRKLAFAALVASLLGRPAPAVADEADDLVTAGEVFAKQGEWTQAITAFKAADASRPAAKHACLIGLAYTRRELWPQAEIFFGRCRARVTADNPAPDWLDDAEPSGRFEAPELAAGVGAGGHPSLTADRLTLFFHRKTTGDSQAVFRATRDAVDLPFGPPAALSQLAPGGLGVVTAPSVSGLGDRLLYTVAVSTTQLQIYEADLNGADFDPGSPEEDVERGGHNDRDATLHVDGDSIVFASDRDGSYDLFVTCE